MGSLMKKQAERFLREKKRHRRWLAMFLCLALLVTSGTFTALRMNGHAMDHGDRVLECKLKVHEHTEKCYNEEGELICGQADYVVHEHRSDCYSPEGELICTLPEKKAHVHDSTCYEEKKTLICEEEEAAGHEHSQECYIEEKGEPQCGLVEHEHDEYCYDEYGNTVCGLEAHQHTDNCYNWTEVLACGQEEGASGHTHTEDCYKEEKVLTCGELELHTHDKETCYDENGELICGELELEEHEHGEGCFAGAEEHQSGEDGAGNNVSGDEISENSVSEDGISDNGVSDDSISENSVSENSVSGNSLSENSITLETKVDNVTITLSGPESSFENGKELSIEAEKVEEDKKLEVIEEAVNQMAEEKEKEVKDYQAFDIKLLADGEEVQPLGPVEVKFSGRQVEKAVENKKTDVEVLHVDEETGKSTDMEATSTEEKEVVIETEHFSVYVYVSLEDIFGKINVTVQHWGENIEVLDGTQTAEKETDEILRVYTEGGIEKAKPKIKEAKKQLYTSDEIEVPNEYYASIEELSKVCKVDENEKEKRYTLSKVWIAEGGENTNNISESWTGNYKEYINENDTWTLNGQKVKQITLSNPSIIRFWYKPEERQKNYDVTFYDYDITEGKQADSNNLKSEEKGVNHPDNYVDANGKKVTETSNRLGIGQFSSGNVSSWTKTAKIGDKFLNIGQGKDVPIQTAKGIVQNQLSGGAKGTLQYNVTAPRNLFAAQSGSGTTVYKNYELGFNQKGDTYILDKVYNNAGQEVEKNLSEFWAMQNSYSLKRMIYSNNFWPMDKVKGTDPLMGNPGGTYKFVGNDGTVKYGQDETNDDIVRYSSTEGAHNWHFGMRYSVDFTIGDYTGPMEYYFRGDDDFWLFVDGELAIDIGGVHRALGEHLNLWTWMEDNGKITYNNGKLQNKNQVHTLDIFFMERGGTGSCCYMQFTVPNTKTVEIPEPETTEYSVTKDWDDDNSPYRPESIKVRLVQEWGEGENKHTRPTEEYVILNKENNWYMHWEGLPLINGSTEGQYNYSYKVEEVNLPPGYTPVLVNGKLTNQLKPVKVEVEKHWQNVDGLEKYLPGSIQVQLYANGEAYKDKDGNPKIITLDADHGWKGEFDNLPEYYNYQLSSDGNTYTAEKVVYSVKEINTDESTIDDNGYLITKDGVQFKVTYAREDYETQTSTPTVSRPQKVPAFSDAPEEMPGVEEEDYEDGDESYEGEETGNIEITEDSASEGPSDIYEANADASFSAAYSAQDDSPAAQTGDANSEQRVVSKLTVTNTLVKNFKIVKKDSNTENTVPLSGAEFKLTQCDGNGNPVQENAAATITSGTDGMLNLNWDDLQANSYYLMEETKAPAGYMLSRVKWIIQIVEKYGMKEIGEVKSFKDYSDYTGPGERPDPENKTETFIDSTDNPGLVLTYTFYNDEIYQLPSTGGTGVYWYTISGMLLMMGASLILYKNKRRRAIRG